MQHVQFLDLRVDWSINSKNQIFFRYNYFRNEYPFNTNDGGLNALDAASDFHDRAHVGGIQLLTTFSATALNELRLSEPYRNEHHVPDPIDGPGPVISISGVAHFNGTPLSAAGSRFGEKIPSVADNFTKIVGTHTIKSGFSWQQNNDNQTSAVYNEYTFPNVAQLPGREERCSNRLHHFRHHQSGAVLFELLHHAGQSRRGLQVEFLRLASCRIAGRFAPTC